MALFLKKLVEKAKTLPNFFSTEESRSYLTKSAVEKGSWKDVKVFPFLF